MNRISDLIVEYASKTGVLPELCRFVDYDPNIGKVPEHWVAEPLVVEAVKHVLAAQPAPVQNGGAA